MVYRTVAFALLLVGAVLLTGVPAFAGDKAPTFALKSADGTSIDLAKLRGKVVVVNFWATWCGPCRMEIPGFIDVYNRYKSKGVEIIGISVDGGGWKVLKPYLEKNKISYPIVLDNANVAGAYGGIYAIPTTFIVDKQGMIAGKHIGFMDKGTLEKLIKDLL